MLALVRPGAALIGAKACFVRRRRGLEPAEPLHPRLAALLGDTENLMIYEDDAMQVIQRLTGLPAARSRPLPPPRHEAPHAGRGAGAAHGVCRSV